MTAQAMILAAGRGERMRPLTDTTPKPLLQVRGKPLMQWHLDALSRGGFRNVLVNTAWLGEQIEQAFGDGDSSHLSIRYSREGLDFGGALETAGGIVRALPRLSDVFWVLAGDVFAPDFEFAQAAWDRFNISDKIAHLWLVPNPDHNSLGDFGLSSGGLALNLPKGEDNAMLTYSTIGLYRKAFFAQPVCDIPAGNPQGIKAPLAPLLRAAMDAGQVSAEIYTGQWADVGTPKRMAVLNKH